MALFGQNAENNNAEKTPGPASGSLKTWAAQVDCIFQGAYTPKGTMVEADSKPNEHFAELAAKTAQD